MVIERASLVVECMNALHDAVQDTLETLTFTEALPLDGEAPTTLTAPLYITTVAVKQPYSGIIRLKISRSLALSLVGSMLGCSDRMEEAWVQDGLSELVNTIGGRVLAHLVDSYSSFDLGIPETVFMDRETSPSEGVLVRQVYTVSESFIVLELIFKKAKAA